MEIEIVYAVATNGLWLWFVLALGATLDSLMRAPELFVSAPPMSCDDAAECSGLRGRGATVEVAPRLSMPKESCCFELSCGYPVEFVSSFSLLWKRSRKHGRMAAMLTERQSWVCPNTVGRTMDVLGADGNVVRLRAQTASMEKTMTRRREKKEAWTLILE